MTQMLKLSNATMNAKKPETLITITLKLKNQNKIVYVVKLNSLSISEFRLTTKFV